MKKIMILIALSLSSCETEIPEEPVKTPCEKAIDYIQECVGYRPYIGNCDNDIAQRILNTPCSNLENLWK